MDASAAALVLDTSSWKGCNSKERVVMGDEQQAGQWRSMSFSEELEEVMG